MIKTLTKEQEAQIPEYIQKWIDLASEPIDRNRVKEIITKIYGEEKTVIIGESFQNTMDLIRVATEGKTLEYDSRLHSQLYSQLDSQLYSQLYSQLRSQLHSQLDSQLRSQLYSQLDSQLYSQLYSQLHSQLRSQLRSRLRSQPCSHKVKYSFYMSYWLQDWAGYYDYAKSIGVKFDEENLKQYFDIILNIPIVIFIGDVIFVCEKPKCLWEDGNLHSDQKPAIGWKDGTGFYFLDAVHFEKELWEVVVSQKMSLSEIMQIENADQRTVALKYNPQAIIKENAKLLDKDNRNNELYLVENSEINNLTGFPKMYFLKMLCPTGRVFIEGVPPEEAEKNPKATAMQALLCGLTYSEYMDMTLES